MELELHFNFELEFELDFNFELEFELDFNFKMEFEMEFIYFSSLLVDNFTKFCYYFVFYFMN